MRQYRAKILVGSCFLTLFSSVGAVQASATWPNVSGTDIGGNLASLYEPSGDTIYQGKLYVVTDEGEVTRMDISGNIKYTTATQSTTLRSRSIALGLGSDLESITTGNDQYLYLGYEQTNKMAQFDPSSMTLTGKIWSFNPTLSAVIGTVDLNNGMEVLTITPHYVITGIQKDGNLYYFSVDFSVSGSATYLGSAGQPSVNMRTLTGDSSLVSDISDLYYSSDTQKVYALYDYANKIVELNEAGTSYFSDLSLPTGNDQEGLTVVSNCATSSSATVYISEDTNGVDHQVWVYNSSYPVTCPAVAPTPDPTPTPTVVDADGDGVDSTLDCNDADPTVSANQTYYRDADADGLGSSGVTISVCSSTPPTGYVTNSLDANDADFDNDGVSTSSDCNDADATISALQTYYLDADGDGLGSDTSSSICSYTVPTGYVNNSNESRDSNDLISNAGVEIAGDLRDNDGDGEIDEYNTLALNGLHPYYSTLDPNNYSLAVSSMINFSGATNGAIKVRFADDSVYRYKIFSLTTPRLTKVRFYNNTGYLLVTSPNGKKVVVNGYTGQVVSTLSTKQK